MPTAIICKCRTKYESATNSNSPENQMKSYVKIQRNPPPKYIRMTETTWKDRRYINKTSFSKRNLSQQYKADVQEPVKWVYVEILRHSDSGIVIVQDKHAPAHSNWMCFVCRQWFLYCIPDSQLNWGSWTM